MKKLIMTAAAVFAFSFTNAQKANFGIKGGLNITNFSGDLKANDTKIGYNLGAFVFVKTSSTFAIQPEVLYSTQGVTESDAIFNLSYINIPVMFKYFPTDKVSLDFGPQLGIKSEATITVTDPISKQKLTVDASNLFNSTDFGLNLGATINATKNLGIGLRYTIGLSNVASQDLKNLVKAQGINDAYGANRVLSINLEYKF